MTCVEVMAGHVIQIRIIGPHIQSILRTRLTRINIGAKQQLRTLEFHAVFGEDIHWNRWIAEMLELQAVQPIARTGVYAEMSGIRELVCRTVGRRIIRSN